MTKGDVTEPFHVISVDHTTKKLRIFAKYCLDKNPVSEGSTFYKQAPGANYAFVDHHFSNASYWDQKWSNQKDKWKDLNINHSENYENDIAIKMAVDYGSYFGGDGKLLTKDEATVMQNNSSMQDILGEEAHLFSPNSYNIEWTQKRNRMIIKRTYGVRPE